MAPSNTTAITYDVIGDVHGYYSKLVQLLGVLGYKKVDGVWQQPGHQAIFVGDLIDKGPQPAEVLEVVKAMVEHNAARMVIGNHELNWIQACAHHTRDLERFIYLTNRHPCRRKLSAYFRHHPGQLADLVEWLCEQPLYIDGTHIRVVHACWHHDSIALLQQSNINSMNRRAVLSYREMYSERHLAMDRVVSGCTHEFPPSRQHKRYRSLRKRCQWWPNKNVHVHPQESVLTTIEQPLPCPHSAPVFFGHYALNGPPNLAGGNLVCVDYSVAYGGPLMAYRYTPGQPLNKQHFVGV